jgi:hypothetical protein
VISNPSSIAEMMVLYSQSRRILRRASSFRLVLGEKTTPNIRPATNSEWTLVDSSTGLPDTDRCNRSSEKVIRTRVHGLWDFRSANPDLYQPLGLDSIAHLGVQRISGLRIELRSFSRIAKI